jgi:hypothetical protein
MKKVRKSIVLHEVETVVDLRIFACAEEVETSPLHLQVAVQFC